MRPRNMSKKRGFILQSLLLPSHGAAPNAEVFYRSQGAVAFSMTHQRFGFGIGGSLDFGAWYNLFNCARWADQGLRDLGLQISGEGAFEIQISVSRPDRSADTVFCEPVTLAAKHPVDLDMSQLLLGDDVAGLAEIRMKSMTDAACLSALDWTTSQPPRRRPRLAVVIPTFHRADVLCRLLSQIEELRQGYASADIETVIVDQAGVCELRDAPGLTVLHSRNLGGSGGFARGLLHAKDRGFSHCLFMDDDARPTVEGLRRAVTFLAYAKEDNAAVAGAMVAGQARTRLWENGARFEQFCQPQFGGADLTSAKVARDIEFTSNPDKALYGGWWLFAFPVKFARHLPFPFFLRGDDVSFSLANPFTITRLNGVVAEQEGFTAKESPRSWYLDLRSHLLHHLSLPELARSRWSAVKVLTLFWGQTILRHHYGSAHVVLLAAEDVLRGPELFAHAGATPARLEIIDHCAPDEVWRDLSEHISIPAPREGRAGLAKRLLWTVMGNGLLLPGFGLMGRKVTIHARDRRDLSLIWGASQVVVLHPGRQKFYLVAQSKRKALGLSVRWLIVSARLLLRYGNLRRAYQESYGAMTSVAYWRQQCARADVQPAAPTEVQT